mmetsp:Transcript_75755/g.231883  ORF Transcript_75755/g.231883 Transcript_75755/m.231883 type:complete len:317 (-) Transcript_75755:139-1089(-)
MTHVLHDVDLAALRPWPEPRVGREHPGGSPGAAGNGDLQADLDAAVQPIRPALRDEASGCELLAAEGLADRPDPQGAFADPGVLGAVGIMLQLAVAPAMPPNIVGPLGGVRAADVIELVGPHEPRGVGGGHRHELGRGGRRAPQRRNGASRRRAAELPRELAHDPLLSGGHGEPAILHAPLGPLLRGGAVAHGVGPPPGARAPREDRGELPHDALLRRLAGQAAVLHAPLGAGLRPGPVAEQVGVPGGPAAELRGKLAHHALPRLRLGETTMPLAPAGPVSGAAAIADALGVPASGRRGSERRRVFAHDTLAGLLL